MFKSVSADATLPTWFQMLLTDLEPATLAAIQAFISDVMAGLPTTPPTTLPGWLAALVADIKPAALQAIQVFIATLLGTSPPAASGTS